MVLRAACEGPGAKGDGYKVKGVGRGVNPLRPAP
jgi:hypothetical protein